MNPPGNRVRPAQAAYILLLVAGVLAGIALVVSASRYVRSTRAVAGFDVAVTEFRLFDDDDSRAELTLRLSNASTVPIAVERFTVTLTLNGKQVGSTQNALAGSRSPADVDAYEEQTRVGRNIEPDSPWGGQIVIYLDTAAMEAIRAQRSAGASAWSAETGVFIALPFSRQREHIVRSINLEEPAP